MSQAEPGLFARRRVAVGVSGSGRSLANLLRLQSGGRGYEVAAVIASRRDCYAVTIAEEYRLPILIYDASKVGAAELYAWLASHSVHWVALAGFVKLFPLIPSWHNRVVNIHPALLPAFGGKGMYGERVHAAVLAAGVADSGATVHFVNERYDEGAIIAQVRLAVRASDSPQSLAARVFAAECQLYPATLNQLIAGALPLADGGIERTEYAEP